MGLLKQICTKLTSFSSYSTTIRFCIPPQVLLSQVASKTAQARVFKAAQLPAKISLIDNASWTKPESPGFITRYLPRSGDDGNQYQKNHGEVWRSAWTTILKYAVVAGGVAITASTLDESRYSYCAGLGQGLYGICHSAICLYAGVRTFRAIQHSDPKVDKQWLTFWLLFSIFELLTTAADLLLGWAIPFYNEAKAAFLVFIGVLGGAESVYPLLEPLLLESDAVARKYENRLAALREDDAAARKYEAALAAAAAGK